jgi:hypothetical protein
MANASEDRFEKPACKLHVVEKILIFIKHKFRIVWVVIEWFNTLIFSFLYKQQLEKLVPEVLEECPVSPFTFRILILEDAEMLHELIQSQNASDLEYFNPHGFDLISIKKLFRNKSFLPMGVFDNETLKGYFFLRFFVNRSCFVGRLIDSAYRGRGIGIIMNWIMYEIAWRMSFRCLSTISRNNTAVMKAHSKNNKMVIIKDLQNDYLLVEFIRTPVK